MKPTASKPSHGTKASRSTTSHTDTRKCKNSRESCARPVNLASWSITQELHFGKHHMTLKNTPEFCYGVLWTSNKKTLQFRQGCNLVRRESHYQCIHHIIIYETYNHVINRYCKQCVEDNYTRIWRPVRNATSNTERNVGKKNQKLKRRTECEKSSL